MSKRSAGIALCALVMAGLAFFDTAGAGASTRATAGAAPLTMLSQTPWVTPSQPWFNLSLAVGAPAVPAGALHVSLTFYTRLDDAGQFDQAIGAVPQKGVLLRDPDVPVATLTTGGARVASACITVLPDDAATPPAGGTGSCAATDPTLTLGCRPATGTCGDVYPVSVALLRQGSSAPLARFTTFVTYQEPGAPGSISRTGGPLRVGVVLPVGTGSVATMATALSDHRGVPATLMVSPVAVNRVLRGPTKEALHTLDVLATLSDDEVVDQPYVPVNVAALSEAGLAGEIQAQVQRGTELLRQGGLRPAAGPWIDTASSFSSGDGANLASGLTLAGAPQLVLSDSDLAPGGRPTSTFAQPFALDLGHGATVPAAAADAGLSGRFTAQPGDPVLGAQQLIAGLSFVHFENASLSDPRGVIVVPPAGWRPSATFLETLLAGLTANPALSPVTVTQLFTQVPVGGNDEPSTRRLQAGPAGHSITRSAAQKISVARVQLSSWSMAVGGSPLRATTPPQITTLSDALLTTEARVLGTAGRAAALGAFDRAFSAAVGTVTLATERTVTFTSGRAPIPITVLSAAPYPVQVVITLASDKFTFPSGNTRTLTLYRPTTSVRIPAQARVSGDRLPIDVTLRTPDGQLLLARTVLTVQSSAISFVGVALTVFAGAVLLTWWARTWRRSRRRRPRAH